MEAHCPSIIEQIPNSGFQAIIRQAFEEKTSTNGYLDEKGKVVNMELSKELAHLLWSYMTDIIKLGVYGVEEGDSRVGFAFELLLGQALKELYKKHLNFKVVYAPASLDFQSKPGNGIDIVGGLTDGRIMVPKFFVSAKLDRDNNMHNGSYNYLGVPVSVLHGGRIFDKCEALATQFVKSPHPQNFAQVVARVYGPKINQFVRFRS